MDWNHIQTVIVPIDLEDADPAGLRLALQGVDDPMDVHVIYVLPDPPATGGPPRRRSAAEAGLRAWLAEQGVPEAVNAHVVCGTPAARIVELADQLAAQLVILPSRGRRGLAEILLGSVAERVVRSCPCAVLVLRSSGEASPLPG